MMFMLLRYSLLKVFKILLITCLFGSNSFGQKDITLFNSVTIRKDTLPLITSHEKPTLILLSNNNSCRDCFHSFNKLDAKFSKKLENDIIEFKILARIPTDTYSRKQHISLLKKEIPDLIKDNPVLFDIYTDVYAYNAMPTTGVFGEYEILHTPALILYTPGEQLEVFKYDLLISYFKQHASFSIDSLIKFKNDRISND